MMAPPVARDNPFAPVQPAPQTSGRQKALPFAKDEEQVIAAALEILERRARYLAERPSLSSPSAVREYLRLRLSGLEHETFWCVFLNTKHQVIATEELNSSINNSTQ